MSEEIFDGRVTEVKNSIHAEYLLNSSDTFYDIGFRVMKNQESGCLLPCHRLKYNGKIKLVYFTDGLVSLEQKLAELDVEQIRMLLSNLFEAIKEVEGNGFLNANCIELRLERIYVDSRTSAIKLIYLPINPSFGNGGNQNIESGMRAKLIKAMRDIRLADHPRVQNVVDVLMDGTLDLDGVVRTLRDGVRMSTSVDREAPVAEHSAQPVSSISSSADTSVPQPEVRTQATVLTLKAVDGSAVFVIDRDEYLLGKSSEKVDGVIAGNPAISRVHCKVSRENGVFYITDMGSSNGTFLNGQRLAPSKKARIEQGNRIRIANMEFMIWR